MASTRRITRLNSQNNPGNMSTVAVQKDIQSDNSDILAQISSMMDDKLTPITDTLATMQNSLDFALTEVQEVQTIKEEVENLQSELAECKKEITTLKKENKDLRYNIDKCEYFNRRENVKILGIDEEKNENIETKVVEILNSVDVKLSKRNFVQVYRIGSFIKKQSRPVLVRFHHFKDKKIVSSKKEDLKKKGVVIVDDYPESIREKRKLVVPTFFKALEICPEKNPKLLLDKLVLDDEVFSADDLHNIDIPDLRPENVFTVSKQGVTAYFSKFSPFSNHYRCKFTIDDVTFTSVEKYLMLKKAELFSDDAVASKIRGEENPVKIKAMAYKINNFNAKKWKSHASEIMFDACLAKFSQNPGLKELLINTGNDSIAEANPTDDIWGIGLPLRSPDVHDQDKWKGKNVAGQTLERVRQVII